LKSVCGVGEKKVVTTKELVTRRKEGMISRWVGRVDFLKEKRVENMNLVVREKVRAKGLEGRKILWMELSQRLLPCATRSSKKVRSAKKRLLMN